MGEVQRFPKHSEDITNTAASQATVPRISTDFSLILYNATCTTPPVQRHLYNATLNLPLGLYGRRTPCFR